MTCVPSSASPGGGIDAAFPVKICNTIIAGNFQGAAASTTANDVAGTLDAASAYNLLGVGGAGALTGKPGERRAPRTTLAHMEPIDR
jgi:hypothetical protein